MAGLRFAGVEKDYGIVHALVALDLEVSPGDLMVLVGPSGSGKSTALRVAAGLEEATGGRILIGERDVTRLPPAERNVAMVFQSYALFPHMTAGENIGFGLQARGVARDERTRRVAEAAALVGCDDLLDRKPHQLSGGERQRVALARALAHEPDVFLLDEPLSSLDARLRVQTRAEIKQLHQRLGNTMLYVTHDQMEALTIGDRVAVLHEGRLQQVGTPDEVYRRPANRFVAGFIGSPAMNFLPASLEDGKLRAGAFTLDATTGARGLAGRSLELGVRPEHVRIDSEGTRAEVRLVETAGNEAYLHLEAGDHVLVARASADARPSPGAALPVAIAPEHVFLFDADTGEALWPPP